MDDNSDLAQTQTPTSHCSETKWITSLNCVGDALVVKLSRCKPRKLRVHADQPGYHIAFDHAHWEGKDDNPI